MISLPSAVSNARFVMVESGPVITLAVVLLQPAATALPVKTIGSAESLMV